MSEVNRIEILTGCYRRERARLLSNSLCLLSLDKEARRYGSILWSRKETQCELATLRQQWLPYLASLAALTKASA